MNEVLPKLIKVICKKYSHEQLAEMYLRERELNRGVYERIAQMQTEINILKEIIIVNGIKNSEELKEYEQIKTDN